METDVLVQPFSPDRFKLPPILNAMFQNLARHPHPDENPLYLELQLVGRQLGQSVVMTSYALKDLDKPVSPREAQRLLIASTGPSSDGRCTPCGRELAAK